MKNDLQKLIEKYKRAIDELQSKGNSVYVNGLIDGYKSVIFDLEMEME